MASTAASTPSKTTPLSYAELARKTQASKPSGAALPPSRIGNTSAGQTTAPSSAATPTAIQSSSSAGADASARAVNHPPSVKSPSPLPSATSSSAVTGAQTNGQSRLSSDPEQQPASGVMRQQQTTPKTPVPNFWNVRKEQLAASRLAAPSSSSTSASIAGTVNPRSRTTSRSAAPGKGTDLTNEQPTVSSDAHAASGPHNADLSPGRARPTSNGMPAVPIISIDAEVWPEVSKAHQPDQQDGVSNQAVAKEAREELAGSKKGEKTKWIPIPATELQAAADAVLKTSKSQSRKRSRGPSRNNRDARSAGRNPSGRNSTSQSAAHSRVQSHAGSVQSSPRLSRGRRLPADEGHTSELTASQTFPANVPLPSRPSQPGSSPGHNITGNSIQPSHSITDVSSASASPPVSQNPPQPYMMYPPHHPFHPPIPAAIHYPPGSSQNGSPSVQPHSIPPAPYPHVPPPYPPIYSMYPGYDYSSPPIPPMFWSGALPPRSGQHSPAYPPFPPDPSLPVPYFQSSPPHITAHAASGVTSPLVVGDTAVTTGAPPMEATGSRLGEKPVLFGSIGIAISEAASESEAGLESLDSSFSKFSIGVSQGDTAPGLRSRSRSNKGHRRPSEEQGGSAEAVDAAKPLGQGEGPGGKWEFGTTSTLNPQTSEETGAPARLSPMSGSVSPTQLPMIPGISPPVPTQILDAPVDIEVEFKVKNFGYGFGRPGGPPAPGEPAVADPYAPRYDGDRPPRGDSNQYGGKGRRSGGNRDDVGFDRERGSGRGGRRGRGSGNASGGGFSGRGGNRSHQRNGSFPGPPLAPRQQPLMNVTQPPFQQPIIPPNNASPGGYYAGAQPSMAPYLPPHGYDTYGLSPAAPGGSLPPPHLSPPVPVPVTTLPFRLDHTRYYLLGQLEYYLSPQNMAQDFFLRQRMDARGWIAIPLIASFNRVRRLTMEVNVVREVLCLSSIVQVRDNWVRMGGWEQFVLPDAAASSVDEGDVSIPYAGGVQPTTTGPLGPTIVVDDGGHMPKIYSENQAEDEVSDEDDVVFVMGKES